MVWVSRDYPNNPDKFNTAVWEIGMGPDGKTPFARLFSPKTVTFNSSADYTWNPWGMVNIDKLFLENDGWITAKNVRIGVSVPGTAGKPIVVVSPNVHLISEQFHEAGENIPAYMDLAIDQLNVDDLCVITIWHRQKSKRPV